MHIGKELQTH